MERRTLDLVALVVGVRGRSGTFEAPVDDIFPG